MPGPRTPPKRPRRRTTLRSHSLQMRNDERIVINSRMATITAPIVAGVIGRLQERKWPECSPLGVLRVDTRHNRAPKWVGGESATRGLLAPQLLLNLRTTKFSERSGWPLKLCLRLGTVNLDAAAIRRQASWEWDGAELSVPAQVCPPLSGR